MCVTLRVCLCASPTEFHLLHSAEVGDQCVHRAPGGPDRGLSLL